MKEDESYKMEKNVFKKIHKRLSLALFMMILALFLTSCAEEDSTEYYDGGEYGGMYSGTETCLDGLVYDNPDAPLFSGVFAAKAKKFKPTLRELMRKEGIECYLDVYLSMLANECSLDIYEKITNGIHNPAQVTSYRGKSGASAEEEALGSIRAGLKNFKTNIDKCKNYKLTDVATAVQGYNFGISYVSIVAQSREQKDSAANRAIYRQRHPGWGTISYSTDVMSRVKGQKLSEVGGNTRRTMSRGTELGNKIVQDAMKYIGNKYVYGGTSLTNGIDCSAFVQAIYAHFGYSLPRTASTQCSSFLGKYKEVKLSEVQPGDLFYYIRNGKIGHVTMYAGNKQVIHASNSKPYPEGGIKLSSYNYDTPAHIFRIIPDNDSSPSSKTTTKTSKKK